MKHISKLAALGLTSAVVSAIAIGGCSDPSRTEEGPVGRLGLNLEIGSTVINSVHYAVTGNGQNMQGDVDTTHVPGDMFGAQIGGIPEGTGFTLALTAQSVDHETTCSGSTNFDVVRNQVTRVTIHMACQGVAHTGSVRADATINDCAVADNLTVLPTAVTLGAQIHVIGHGSDQEGDTLTYHWSSNGAASTFVNAAAPDTMFNCNDAGDHTVTISVTDGDGLCVPATLTATITCIAVECGNGTVGTGEECDPPGTATCDANCQRVAVCGDGFTDAPETCDDHNTTSGDGCSATCVPEICGDGVLNVGEQCDDGNLVTTDACTATCRTATCGDSIVRTGVETCDPPNGTTCDATCHGIAPAVCGNWILEPTEQCDPAGVPVGAQMCSATCSLAADGCAACQQDNCAAFAPFGGADLVAECFANTTLAAAGPGAGTEKRRLCAAVVACVNASNCADGGNPTSDCFCGAGVDPGMCGTPAGPCVAQIQAAAETTVVDTILERYVDPAWSVGNAMRLFTCEQFVCSSQCGL